VIAGACSVLERTSRRIELAHGIVETSFVISEPGERQMAMLFRLRFDERDRFARDELLTCSHSVGTIERDLREKKARFDLTPRILETLEQRACIACVLLREIRCARIERGHREESFRRRFTTGRREIAEALARVERRFARGIESPFAMIGVCERDVALCETEPISNRVEFGASRAEELTRKRR